MGNDYGSHWWGVTHEKSRLKDKEGPEDIAEWLRGDPEAFDNCNHMAVGSLFLVPLSEFLLTHVPASPSDDPGSSLFHSLYPYHRQLWESGFPDPHTYQTALAHTIPYSATATPVYALPTPPHDSAHRGGHEIFFLDPFFRGRPSSEIEGTSPLSPFFGKPFRSLEPSYGHLPIISDASPVHWPLLPVSRLFFYDSPEHRWEQRRWSLFSGEAGAKRRRALLDQTFYSLDFHLPVVPSSSLVSMELSSADHRSFELRRSYVGFLDHIEDRWSGSSLVAHFGTKTWTHWALEEFIEDILPHLSPNGYLDLIRSSLSLREQRESVYGPHYGPKRIFHTEEHWLLENYKDRFRIYRDAKIYGMRERSFENPAWFLKKITNRSYTSFLRPYGVFADVFSERRFFLSLNGLGERPHRFPSSSYRAWLDLFSIFNAIPCEPFGDSLFDHEPPEVFVDHVLDGAGYHGNYFPLSVANRICDKFFTPSMPNLDERFFYTPSTRDLPHLGLRFSRWLSSAVPPSPLLPRSLRRRFSLKILFSPSSKLCHVWSSTFFFSKRSSSLFYSLGHHRVVSSLRRRVFFSLSPSSAYSFSSSISVPSRTPYRTFNSLLSPSPRLFFCREGRISPFLHLSHGPYPSSLRPFRLLLPLSFFRRAFFRVAQLVRATDF